MRCRSRAGRTAVRLGLTGVRWIPRIAAIVVVVAAVLIVVVLTASVIFNKATSETGTPVEQLWHGSFVEAGGRMNAYREWGSHGSPIVLLGGFLEPSFVWGLVGPQLAAHGHRVYALDLDGFGYTERHGPWTLEGWSDQVEAFTRALGIEDPTIVGHSLGAAVAVETVRDGNARRIVLVDGDARTDGGPPDILRELVSHTPLVTSALRLSLRWDWPVRKILADAYGAHGPVIDHELVQMWTDQLHAVGAEHAIDELVKGGVPGLSQSELRNVRAQATVVWGAADTVDSVQAGRQTAADLHAPFVSIPNAGHLAPLTYPGAVARAIDAAAGR